MPESLETNTTISHYRIAKKIGAGGMGEVFLAEDTHLRRKVAIKVLPAEITENRERLQRFEQEAFAASALNHPHILTIHEFGKAEEGTHFIVMEYVEGFTLNEHRTNNEMGRGEILDVIIQVASALSAAHEAGIVHRDIKPENIMLRRDGYVKVLDFGLAKLTEKNKVADSDAEAETRALVNTNPGAIMGTAAYMSPEQARGLKVDARTDIWSLGCVLYEMLSGHKPFTGATPTDIIVAVVNKEPPPISSYAPDVPAELAWIVSKSLQKETDARYQTAKEFLADLRRIKQRIEFEDELERSTAPETRATKETEAAPTLIHPQTIAGASTKSNQLETHSLSSAEYIASEIKRHKSFSIAALVILLLAIGGFGYWFYANRSASTDGKQINSIAVLPFENGSGDPNLDYLSDGLSESLIDKLSQLPQLKVIARNSSFKYRGANVDVQDAANKLGVRAIVMGKIMRVGDNLTVRVEMIDAQENRQLW
ncbi:MAG: serine/threonine-protein kinase, partial [Acidobacteria bacterium]|nr:serine/threonine-protein kinase [Acidobacteriota bacterium]